MSKALFGVLALAWASVVVQAQTIYVATNGSDAGKGTLQFPFKTLARAQQQVRTLKKQQPQASSIRVMIRKGTYVLNKRLEFSAADGGKETQSVTYAAYANERVMLSGGATLPARWTKVAGVPGTLWKISVAELLSQGVLINQLFLGDTRLPRCASDWLYTAGPLQAYASLIKKDDYQGLGKLKRENMEAVCGFTYQGKALDSLTDYVGAELLIYNSWEASWHTIREINAKSKAVYFKNPMTYPVGFFANRLRYRIENSKDFLRKPGQWYVDLKNKELYYYAKAGENPNRLVFTVPTQRQWVKIQGTPQAPVRNLHFEGLTFAYSASSRGIHVLSPTLQQQLSQRYSWLNFKEGFSTYQAAVQDNQAIQLTNARGCTFEKCAFIHTGDYAMLIGEYTADNAVKNCRFTDLGSGGIILGLDENYPYEKKLPLAMSPARNQVVHSLFERGGLVKPGAVAISIMQANHCRIEHNQIAYFPYSGISVGWTWDDRPNFTTDNLIQYNVIHDVMQQLADGGGIYTLGNQKGSIYKGNYIYNVGRAKDAVGSSNNGFFFDQGSSGFLLDSNAVRSISSADYRLNRTDASKIQWGSNHFEKSRKNQTLLQSVQRRNGAVK